MFLKEDCQWSETSQKIWIDTNANCDPGMKRLCMIDKKEKKIEWQLDNKNLELNFKMIEAFYKLIKELGWNK